MSDPVTLLANLPQRFPQVRRWCIAFSGGLDSQVLLSAAVQALPLSSILVLHVNHQLQTHANAWQEHARQTAEKLGVEFVALKVDPVSSSEASARNARYSAFSQILGEGDALLMAHHADDQAETLMFRLCRGSGVAGLVGIPDVRALDQAIIIRPWLTLSREELHAWAKQHSLDWVEDPTNQHTDYDRNYLRLEVLPTLRARWPKLNQRLVETASHMSEAQSILQDMAALDWQQVAEMPEVIRIPPLLSLSLARQHNLLRYWLAGHSISLSESQLEQLRVQFFSGGHNPERLLKLNDRYGLRTYRQRLFLTPLVAHDLKRQEMKLSQLMILPAGELHLPESILAYDQSLSIDYGRQDDKIYPAGRGVGKSLKQLFQEKGVPPWLRASWPLLGDEKGVLWVPGICFDQRWQKKEDSVGSWQPFGLSEQPFFVSLQYHLDPS